jgi:prepilin signal peptidase PulO-like enzyme (type II secretory pathway)
VAFVLLHIIRARMGFGDVKLLVLGLFLGYLGWGEPVLGLFWGFSTAGHRRRPHRHERSRRDHVPFGPFLAAGNYDACHPRRRAILDWYSVKRPVRFGRQLRR